MKYIFNRDKTIKKQKAPIITTNSSGQFLKNSYTQTIISIPIIIITLIIKKIIPFFKIFNS